ncbi:hypothetical protein F5Y11DRAFT_346662 [Daldinia sp. FL1419]|nr:hypothetical protein F5Y11DRAFT_346662 [Daldinia sp. FL1419]
MVRAVLLQSQIHTKFAHVADPITFSYIYCSGVVIKSSPGPRATSHPGDSVLATYNGVVRSHIRLPTHRIIKLPKELSFSDVCTASPFPVAAYNALVEVGCAKQSDYILVHNGCTPSEQSALRLLSSRGVKEVWRTHASQDDSTWISEHLGIEEHCILPQVWFNSQSTVFSSLIPRFDIVLTTKLQVFIGSLNWSYERWGSVYSREPRKYTLAVNEREFRVKTFRATEIYNSFKHMQKTDRDIVIVEFNKNDVVNVRATTHPAYYIDPDASYLIIGGLGGIGRAITRWMVTRGARYLILLSRSGLKTSEAQQFLSELHKDGV